MSSRLIEFISISKIKLIESYMENTFLLYKWIFISYMKFCIEIYKINIYISIQKWTVKKINHFNKMWNMSQLDLFLNKSFVYKICSNSLINKPIVNFRLWGHHIYPEKEVLLTGHFTMFMYTLFKLYFLLINKIIKLWVQRKTI